MQRIGPVRYTSALHGLSVSLVIIMSRGSTGYSELYHSYYVQSPRRVQVASHRGGIRMP